MFILSNQIIIITSLRGLSYNEFLNLKDSVKITRYDIGYIHPIYKMLISLHVDFKIKKFDHWKISDDSNIDQYKAVTGICFMIGILTILGLYSNLL